MQNVKIKKINKKIDNIVILIICTIIIKILMNIIINHLTHIILILMVKLKINKNMFKLGIFQLKHKMMLLNKYKKKIIKEIEFKYYYSINM